MKQIRIVSLVAGQPDLFPVNGPTSTIVNPVGSTTDNDAIRSGEGDTPVVVAWARGLLTLGALAVASTRFRRTGIHRSGTTP